jgi:type VI secretion system protein ImpJ
MKIFMDAHDIPDAIQWHEGLLLTPQHFQQLSSRHEALVQYGTSMAAPFCWGMRRFKHDAITLPTGKLRVQELEGIMPDGLVVSHGLHSAGRDNVLEVDLKELPMTDRGLIVHLAVAARHGGDSNGDLRRYESFKGVPVADEIPGGTPREIHRLKPLLSLHVAETMPAKYVSFPLTRVIHKDSSYKLDMKFIPPLLAVPFPGDAASDAALRLGEMCSKAAQRVRRRAMVLADLALNHSTDGPIRDDAATKMLMLSLVGALPYLEAVLKTGVAHPYMVYLALCSMAGQLAVMRTEMVPPSFKPYNHDDLYSTFDPVLNFIKSAIDQGVPLSYKTFPFQYREDGEGGVYELQFDGAWAKKRLALGIKGQPSTSETDVVKWGQNCLIASQGGIELMRKKRIKGAGRKHADRVGDVIPAGSFVLFSLNAGDADDAGASFIELDQKLQILNRDGVRPAEIVLHVIDN